jgi:hypothetical protein
MKPDKKFRALLAALASISDEDWALALCTVRNCKPWKQDLEACATEARGICTEALRRYLFPKTQEGVD